MGKKRINPPSNARSEIERLAAKGYSTVGLAKHFKVSRRVITRWFEEDENLEECYEQGRDSYRQRLEEQIVQMTLAGKTPAGLIYLLKSKFKMYDMPSSKTDVNVGVGVQVPNVLVMQSHGSDEEWEKRAAEQQAALTASVRVSSDAQSAAQEPETNALPVSAETDGKLIEAEVLPPAQIPSFAPPSWMPEQLACASSAPSWRRNA